MMVPIRGAGTGKEFEPGLRDPARIAWQWDKTVKQVVFRQPMITD
jgi:hypothetical protein